MATPDETNPLLQRLTEIEANPSQGGTTTDSKLQPPPSAFAVKAGMFDHPAQFSHAALQNRMPVDQVAEAFRTTFGQDAPPQYQQAYQNELRLEQERDRFKGAQESTYGYAARRMLPVASSIFGRNEAQDYADAVKRYREGKPQEGDYAVIAGHERLQQIDKERSTGEAILAGVAHVPAILGEGFVAGKLVGAGARVLRGAEAVAPLAAGEVVAKASTLSRVGSVAAKLPATTALMPSMYLEAAGQRAVQNGGEWTDQRNLIPAFAMGMANVAVLGSLQRFVKEGSLATQIVGKTALGMGEQAVVDTSAQILSDRVLNKAWKVETGYGLAGDILKAAQGQKNEALRHALTQASVFGVFSAIHVAQARRNAQAGEEAGDKFMQSIGDLTRDMETNGYSSPTAAGVVAKLAAEANRAAQTGDTTGLKDAIKANPDDPANKVREQAVSTIEELAKRLGTTPEKALAAIHRGFLPPDILKRAAETTPEPELSKPETPNPPAEPPVADVVTHDPVAILGEDVIRSIATKPLGLRANAKLDTILQGIAKSPSLRAIVDARIQAKLAETRQPTTPEVDETTRGPETAPAEPGKAEVVTKPQEPPEPTVRPVETTVAKPEGHPSDEAVAKRLGKDVEWVRANRETPIVRAARVEVDPDMALREIGLPEHRLADANRLGKGTVVEFDIKNMKGVSQALGGEAQGGVFADRIAEAVRAEFARMGVKARLYRVSNNRLEDTYSVIVPRGSEQAVRAVMARAEARVRAMAEEAGVHEVPHTKEGKAPGTGIAWGQAEFRQASEAREAFQKASEESKAEPQLPIRSSESALKPLTVLDRMRLGQQRREQLGLTRAPEPVVPKPKPVKPKEVPEEQVQIDPRTGKIETEPVEVQATPDVRTEFDIATGGVLSKNEQYVLQQRINGLSYEQIGIQGHEDGGLVKGKGAKQKDSEYVPSTIHKMEKDAIAKLEKAGVGKEILDQLKEQANTEEAALAAKILAGKVQPGELTEAGLDTAAKTHRSRRSAREAADVELEQLATRLIKVTRRLERVRDTESPTDTTRKRERTLNTERDRILARIAELDHTHSDEAAGAKPTGEGPTGGLPQGVPARPPAGPSEAAMKKRAASKSPEDSLVSWAAVEAHIRPADLTKALRKFQDRSELERYLKSKGSGLDELAEMARKRGVIPDDPAVHAEDALFDALKADKKIGQAAAAQAELDAREHDRRQQAEYKERVKAGEIKEEPYTPSSEEIPFSAGKATPRDLGHNDGSEVANGPPLTVAQINTAVNTLFARETGALEYRGEKRLPGGAEARADLPQQATTVTKEADQNPWVTLEEAAHHLSYTGKFETDPTRLREDVVRGFDEINSRFFGRRYQFPSRANIVEGYAAWAKLRAMGKTANLTGDAKAAADFAEKWSQEKGYGPLLDKIGPLYQNLLNQSPTQIAQGLGSSTGKPLEAERTTTEILQAQQHAFLEAVDNDLNAALRFEAAIDAQRKREGKSLLREDEKLSTLLAASRTGKAGALAAQWARDGMPVLTADGHFQKNGMSLTELEAGAKPEWLERPENGGASVAGAYHTAWHLTTARELAIQRRTTARLALEDARQRRDAAPEGSILREALNRDAAAALADYKKVERDTEGQINAVTQDMFDAYKKALDSWNADPEFRAWAEPYAKRMTAAFDAQREFLVSIGELTPEQAKAEREKFPTYSPLERVRGGEAGWNTLRSGKKGERAPGVVFERSGSGEAIVDPRLVHQRRLLMAADLYLRNRTFQTAAKLAEMPGAGPFLQFFNRTEGARTAAGAVRAEELRAAGMEPETIRQALKEQGIEDSQIYYQHEPWPTDGSKPTYEGKVNGEVTSMRVGDRGLYELLTNQQVEAHQTARTLNGLANLKVFGVAPIKAQAQAVRTLATGTSLAFQIKNTLRDSYEFWKNTIDRSTVPQLPGEYMRMYGRMLRTFLDNGREYLWGKEARKDRPEDPLWNQFRDQRGDQLKQFAFERDNPEAAYNGIKSTPTLRSLLKDVLNVMGAGELAPRFLEWKNKAREITGKSEAELREMYDRYQTAVAKGEKAKAPLSQAQENMLLNAAWEVTVPFPRQGVVTRQFNQITPFFGPAVAGVSKAIRNWKDNPKGALYALGALSAARILHWSLVKDEPWYEELAPHDKFNNFVVPTPFGPRRIPGPRDLDIAVGGSLVTMLDAAAGKDPRFRGLLEQSLEGVLPPVLGPAAGNLVKGEPGMALAHLGGGLLGPAGTTGVELLANKDWTGKPIVPKREQDTTSAFDQFADRYGPYALKQLTGGRGELSMSGAGLNPVPRVRQFHESVDELYERYHDLEVEKAKANRSGTRFANDAEFRRLDAARREIAVLAGKMRGERKAGTRVIEGEKPEDDVRQELALRQAAIARRALRK